MLPDVNKRDEFLALAEELKRREAMRTDLPRDWKPRPYQQELWDYMVGGGLRAVEIAHRRWGKDELALNWTCRAAHHRIGNYWHMLPEANQARKAIWEAVNPNTAKRRVDEAFPKDLRASTRESDMFIKFTCGSTWQVVGSDNFDSLVGSPPVGLIFSEWALADPRAWSMLRPILDENGGWVIFITTPRGDNHALGSLKLARDTMEEFPVGDSRRWFGQVSPATDTGVFTKEGLELVKKQYEMEFGPDDGNALYEQEYLCSFDAPLVGAFYARQLRELEDAGRMPKKLEVEAGVPVQTAWDLGYSDDTTIWWFQVVGREIRVLDFFSDHGHDVAYYCDIVNKRGYDYGKQPRHWVPWDAKPKTLAAPRPIIQQAWECGVKMRLVPKLSVEDGIQAVRRTLPHCIFDREKCEKGIDALRYYKRDFDKDKKVFKRVPLHDWTSHAADAFRYLSVAWTSFRPPDTEEPPKPIDKLRPMEGITMDKLFEDRTNERLRNMELTW